VLLLSGAQLLFYHPVPVYEITRSQCTAKLEATTSSETSVFMYQTMRGLGAMNIETAGLTEMWLSICQKQ
jgi:hypothetical protein